MSRSDHEVDAAVRQALDATLSDVHAGDDLLARIYEETARSPVRRTAPRRAPWAAAAAVLVVLGALGAAVAFIGQEDGPQVAAGPGPAATVPPTTAPGDVEGYPVHDYVTELAQGGGVASGDFTLPSGTTVSLSFPEADVTSTAVRYWPNLVSERPERHDLSVSPGDADAFAMTECLSHNARCRVLREPLSNGMTLVKAVVEEGSAIDDVHVVETEPGYFIATFVAASNVRAQEAVGFIEKHVGRASGVPYALPLVGYGVERSGLFLTVETTQGPAQVAVFDGCDPPQGFGDGWRCLGPVQVRAATADYSVPLPGLTQAIRLVRAPASRDEAVVEAPVAPPDETPVVAPGATPAEPTVTISPEGPYEPGQTVALDGSGFQPNQRGIAIGWCGFRTDTPEQEIQGDARYGYTPCAYPDEGLTADADSSGRFRIEDFPLPDGPFGYDNSADCADPSTRCGLAWHPGEAELPVFVTLFEIRQ